MPVFVRGCGKCCRVLVAHPSAIDGFFAKATKGEPYIFQKYVSKIIKITLFNEISLLFFKLLLVFEINFDRSKKFKATKI